MIQIFNPVVCESVRNSFRKYEVCVDSGHGWLTAGKRSVDGSLRENEFNTAVQDKLALMLHNAGIRYHIIAKDWDDEELPKRSAMEREIAEKSNGRQVIGVSIHADGCHDTSAHGLCVYYYKKNGTYSRKGKELARKVADAIIASDRTNGHVITPRHDNGIAGANFHMLRETSGVWILIENGFMTHDQDLACLKDDGFRNDRAMAILEGFYNYTLNN